jgi:hypothetical protein
MPNVSPGREAWVSIPKIIRAPKARHESGEDVFSVSVSQLDKTTADVRGQREHPKR